MEDGMVGLSFVLCVVSVVKRDRVGRCFIYILQITTIVVTLSHQSGSKWVLNLDTATPRGLGDGLIHVLERMHTHTSRASVM